MKRAPSLGVVPPVPDAQLLNSQCKRADSIAPPAPTRRAAWKVTVRPAGRVDPSAADMLWQLQANIDEQKRAIDEV